MHLHRHPVVIKGIDLRSVWVWVCTNVCKLTCVVTRCTHALTDQQILQDGSFCCQIDRQCSRAVTRNAHTHTQTYTLTRTHTHTNTLTCSNTQRTKVHTQRHTRIHTRAHTQKHTHTYTHTNMHTNTQVSKDRLALTCSLCRQPYGAPIQCAGGRQCMVAFHPLCARNAGLPMVALREVRQCVCFVCAFVCVCAFVSL